MKSSVEYCVAAEVNVEIEITNQKYNGCSFVVSLTDHTDEAPKGNFIHNKAYYFFFKRLNQVKM